MYETEDTPAPAEVNEWDIPDLTLEFKGDKGSVQFKSLEDLSGRDIDRLRSQMGAAKNNGEMANVFYLEAAVILITSWDVPSRPTLPIPKGDKKSWDSIPAVVRRQIEKYVEPYLNKLVKEPDGDPSAPASE